MQQRCTSTRAIPSRDAANRDCFSCRLHRRHYPHPSPCLPSQMFWCVCIHFVPFMNEILLSFIDDSFLYKNLTSLNLLKLLLYGLVTFSYGKIDCRTAALRNYFFFYPTDGLNISDGVERVILCLGFYQWSSSSEGWPIGEPFSVIGEENTQYYRLFFDLNCRQDVNGRQ